MTYKLYLDDERTPKEPEGWLIARSSKEAVALLIERGAPVYMSLDHDLGGEDTAMVFLKAFAEIYDLHALPPPQWQIHSSNPCGRDNICAFMTSWTKIHQYR